MTAETRPLAELTSRAIELLSRELGAVETLRFVNQFTVGYGDYTAERESFFGSLTLDGSGNGDWLRGAAEVPVPIP